MDFQLLSPILTFLGTLVVAIFGYTQWRKQHGNPNRSAIAEQRRRSSEDIWSELEEINLALRESSPSQRSSLTETKKRINVAFLKRSLYLDDSLQPLLTEYIQSLHRVADILLDRGSPAERVEWSATMPAWDPADDAELQDALRLITRLRQSVKTKLLAI